MIYLLDTNVFIVLSNFYVERFPSLWEEIDEMTKKGQILSTTENFNEYTRDNFVKKWMDENKHIFHDPSLDEILFIKEIFKVPVFQTNITRKELIKGKAHADPFLIAKAKCCEGTVVTMEKLAQNSGKIPNICQHFSIPCIDFEGFMERQAWRF